MAEIPFCSPSCQFAGDFDVFQFLVNSQFTFFQTDWALVGVVTTICHAGKLLKNNIEGATISLAYEMRDTRNWTNT